MRNKNCFDFGKNKIIYKLNNEQNKEITQVTITLNCFGLLVRPHHFYFLLPSRAVEEPSQIEVYPKDP